MKTTKLNRGYARKLTKEQIDVLNHTANRTANNLYCVENDIVKSLVDLGLMYPAGKTGFCPNKYFGLTPTGWKVQENGEFYT